MSHNQIIWETVLLEFLFYFVKYFSILFIKIPSPIMLIFIQICWMKWIIIFIHVIACIIKIYYIVIANIYLLMLPIYTSNMYVLVFIIILRLWIFITPLIYLYNFKMIISHFFLDIYFILLIKCFFHFISSIFMIKLIRFQYFFPSEQLLWNPPIFFKCIYIDFLNSLYVKILIQRSKRYHLFY